ncbi:MAG: hypothetical protein KF773_20660 [Deltaproteobacteria bacterium]|nr:hypothetical protein [Deltaproteobacteria bacterium]MCW5802730.1 hypothetical protein [Deltaproteobacteria bacterium]
MKRVLALVAMAGLVGCPADEDKASTWAKRLDSTDYESALKRLDEIGDPSAIEDLGEAWRKTRKPEILSVIIGLAAPLTPEQAKANFKTDYEESGRPASWKAAMPFLTEAVTKTDETNAKKVEAAAKCATAIGLSKDPDGLPALIEVAERDPSQGLINLQMEAVKAIGKYDNDKNAASNALVKIINNPNPPAHPKTVGKDQKTTASAKYTLYLKVTGAAVNALGDLGATTATKTLLLALYRTPELFDQIRRALVATGPAARDELRAVIQGKNAEIEKYFAHAPGQPKKQSRAFYCGDRSDRNDDDCVPVSAKDHFAAIILGDFYDPDTVPDLLAILDRPAAPAYFGEQRGDLDEPGPIQYNAVFDALKKIGSPAAAPRIRAIWLAKDKKDDKKDAPKPGSPAPPPPPPGSDAMNRALAASTYPFVTRDDVGLKELGEIAGKNGEDEQLRRAAAESFARLSKSDKDMAVLDSIAARFYDEANKKRTEADGEPKKKADAAEEQYKKDKALLDEAKQKVQEVARDKSKTAADVNEAAASAKRAKAEFAKAEKKYKDGTRPFKELDRMSRDYRSFARLFLSHKSRIEVAQRCTATADPVACYVGTLNQKVEDAVKFLRPHIKDLDETEAAIDAETKKLTDNLSDTQRKELQKKIDELKKAGWSKVEKQFLLQGNIERAMLEVGKAGKAAEKYTEQLLDGAKSDDRLIRQSILYALPKIVKTPCDSCVKKLAAAIKAGEGKNALLPLQLDTQMLRNFFIYAGNRQPKPEDK